MARKPRTRTDAEPAASEGTVEDRLDRLEGEVEEINLSASVQAKDVQTLRARLEQLKAEMDEISEGASAEDLTRVEGQLTELSGRLEGLHEGHQHAAGRVEAVEKEARALAARMEELARGDGVEKLRQDLEARVDGLRQEVKKEAASAKAEDLDQLKAELGEVQGRIDSARQGLRTELDSIHEVLRADLEALKKDLEARAGAEDLELVRRKLQDLESATGDAQGLGQRAREALELVGKLEDRLKATEGRFQEISLRVEESALQAEGQLERMELAVRLVEQLDDRVRRVGAALDGIALDGEDDFEVAAEAELGFELADLLQVMIKHQASDLHLKVGTPPTVRLDGELIPVGNQVLSPDDCKHLVLSAMSRSQRRLLAQRREVDLAYAIPGARFRVNAFMERGNLSAAFRMLRTEMPTIEDLGLPAVLKKLASLNNGLIVVTGPAGSGKSTTLAAMIDYINTHRKMHVITIEDPIEFFHKDKLSIVTQREVGSDTSTFADALRQALRQDPNVIMVGEMRDPETIMTAVVAAETGHLVLSTLHTPNTVQAVDRIIDTFSGEAQRQFRLLLSNGLRGVISQRLLTRADEKGRVPATEVMLVTPTIASLILEGNTQEIYPYIQQGASEGMQTFTQSLLRLYEAGLISKDEAMFHADQPTEFRLGVEGHSTATSSNISEDTLMNWL